MRVLITGGSGFIGRNLSEYLKAQKEYEVFTPSHAELDLLDSDALEKFVKGNKLDIIFHAANIGGGRKSRPQEVLDKNLRMFFNIERCKGFVKRIIVCGSGAEYGKQEPIAQVREESWGERIPADEYGFSKYIMSSVAECSDNIIVLRFFGVFGKYEDYEFKFISNAIVKNFLKMPITIRQNVFFDFLYIDDCVKLIEKFMDRKPKHEAYNLVSGNRVDLVTLAETINRHSDFKSEIKVLNPGLNREYTADNSRLIKDFGKFEFTPFSESIPTLIGYYRSILPTIDEDAIRTDAYAKKCKIVK